MIEKRKKPLTINDRDKIAIKIYSYNEDKDSQLSQLKYSVTSYNQPTKSVGLADWKVLSR